MAKELPYFRVTCQEWQNGDIVEETLSTQGLFMQICCYYWTKNCSVSIKKLEKKFKNNRKMIKNLSENKIIKVRDGFVKINFLDDQWVELSEYREKKRKAGAKGGKQKASNAKANPLANPSYKDKDKDKDKSSGNSNQKFNPDSIPYRASTFLFQKILERNPDHKKPDFQKWAEHVDKMIRIDKRDAHKIAAVIEFCQQDDFWQNNILSTKKLREQYDKLILKAGNIKPLKPRPATTAGAIQMQNRNVRVRPKVEK